MSLLVPACEVEWTYWEKYC